MELSAKLLHEVEFKERWRGYDPEEVDAFLEQVARGVEALQDRLRDVERSGRARAERPEGREPVREPRELGTDDELRRVLVLAQRTADTAVREAREEAERLVAEARAHAEQVTSTADAYGTRVRREADEDVARRVQVAEDEVVAAGAGALQRLNEEVARLEGRRDELQQLAVLAEDHLSEHRARAARAVEQLQRLVDDPSSLGAVPMAARPPAALDEAALDDVDDVDEVDDTESLLPELEGDELSWDDDEDEDAATDGLDDDGVDDLEGDDGDELGALDDLDDPDDSDDEVLPAAALDGRGEAALIDLAEGGSLLEEAATGELYLGLDDVPSVSWGQAVPSATADDGPATQAMAPMEGEAEVDEDAYLAELRQAIAADETLSPAAEAFFNQAAYEDDRWKGLRRRR